MSSHIKKKVAELLSENKLSAASLEKKAGLKEGAVSNILKEKSLNPSFNTIYAISNVLECSLYDFIIAKENISYSNEFLAKNIEWNYFLFLDATKIVVSNLKKYNLNVDFGKITSLINEIYLYSLEKDRKSVTVDQSFAEWLIKNNFKKIFK